MALPEVVSREEWLEARRRLLGQEKEETREGSPPSTPSGAGCRWCGREEVRVRGPGGTVTLADLFGDRSQLIVQHVMFGPELGCGLPGLHGRRST